MDNSFLEHSAEEEKKHALLLKNIKGNLSLLKKTQKEISGHWEYEDLIYRYYHHSFKVYYLQGSTTAMVALLKTLSPHKDKDDLNEDFMTIVKDGTGKTWNCKHNQEWDKHCRPIIEAFLHAKYFLEMAVKYGKELKKAPNVLPSGWASLLCLYKLR
jgi:hypothetical protein